MRILHLTVKKKWYDMIAIGEKREEYREIKSYWEKRLSRKYDAVCFRNGYSPDAPTMIVELKSIHKGIGITKWGAPKNKVFVLKLGKILSKT